MNVGALKVTEKLKTNSNFKTAINVKRTMKSEYIVTESAAAQEFCLKCATFNVEIY